MNKPKKFIRLQSKVLADGVRSFKFPNISLIIPAITLPSRIGSAWFLTAFATGFLFMAIFIVFSDVHRNQKILTEARSERTILEAQLAKWNRLMEDYKDYRDGYYQLALMELQLGHTEKSSEYIAKAIDIDPDFQEVKDLLFRIR